MKKLTKKRLIEIQKCLTGKSHVCNHNRDLMPFELLEELNRVNQIPIQWNEECYQLGYAEGFKDRGKND